MLLGDIDVPPLKVNNGGFFLNLQNSEVRDTIFSVLCYSSQYLIHVNALCRPGLLSNMTFSTRNFIRALNDGRKT